MKNSLIGKRYTPGDNSYIKPINNIESRNHYNLFGKETIIISEIYPDKVESSLIIGQKSKFYDFVNVNYGGTEYRVMWNPGWVKDEDVESEFDMITVDGKKYILVPVEDEEFDEVDIFACFLKKIKTEAQVV